jgi:hypothetical protein
MAERLNLTRIKRIIAYRDAGYSASVIASRVGCHPRTVFRICQRFAIGKRKMTAEAVERARSELTNDDAFVAELKGGLRVIALDSIAQTISLRNRIASTLENIESRDLETAALAARALAACATAIRVSADAVRGLEATTSENEPPPEIVIGVMTDDEVEQVRKANHAGNDEADDLDGEALAELFGDNGE